MATVLAAGDIAFTAYQADNDGGEFNADGIEFVLLVPVTSGTVIYFTDNGYRTDSNTFRTNEGLLRWTAQSDLPAGSLIVYRGNNTTTGQPANTAEWTAIDDVTGAVLTTSTFSLAAAADSIHAFQDPVFGGAELLGGRAISAIYTGTSGAFETTYGATSGTTTTALASGLTDGVNAISTGQAANARYNEAAVGSIEQGSIADVRGSINNDTFWSRTNTGAPFTPGGHSAGTFAILNQANVSINDVSIAEGNTGAAFVTFTVSRSNNAGAFTLNYATANGTATSGTDYSAAAGTLTFTAGGSLTQTISVLVIGERTFEANESYFVNLTNISNSAAAVFTDAQGLGTITNDDLPNTPPVLDLNGAGGGTSVALSYTENATTVIAPAATLTDSDSGNFDGGSLRVAFQSPTANDNLSIETGGQITVSGNTIGILGMGVNFATFAGGAAGADLVFTFNSTTANTAVVQEMVRQIRYTNTSNNPATSAIVNFTLNDGDGTLGGGVDTGTASATITISGVDDAPVAVNDSGTVAANSSLSLAVVGNDTDVDGGAPTIVSTINGQSIAVGGSATLASGATVTRNVDGTLTYNPNGAYNSLVSSATAAATGASNTTANDSFTYAINGGSTATVTMTINGTDGVGDILRGTPGIDVLSGTAAGDTIDALASNDEVNAGDGDDIINGGDGDDTLRGQGGTDTLNGGFGRDLMDGGDGNDTLRGGTGIANEMGGGAGDDLFFVEAIGDSVLEGLNQGIDRVSTGLAVYSLTANVENLTSTNVLTATTFVGNILDNVMIGTSVVDDLFGREGNDRLEGGSGSANTMLGQQGDDVYIVSAAGDSVIEFVGEGTDLVETALSSFVLRDHVENLTYTGTGNFTGVGSASDNSLRGGAGADFLSGLDGADTITGGSGADTLLGGAGADQFRYTGGETGLDRVFDFASGLDKIALANTGFTHTATVDFIQTGAPSAISANSTFLYDVNSGIVSYDADGTGAGVAVALAQINAGLTLGAGDFIFF